MINYVSSFDNPAQSASAFQYVQMLQQERMLMEVQNQVIQNGMAMDGQMELPAVYPNEQEFPIEGKVEEKKEEVKEEHKAEVNIEDNQEINQLNNIEAIERAKEEIVDELPQEELIQVNPNQEEQKLVPVPEIGDITVAKSEVKKKQEKSIVGKGGDNSKALKSIYMGPGGKKNPGKNPVITSAAPLKGMKVPIAPKEASDKPETDPTICVFVYLYY